MTARPHPAGCGCAWAKEDWRGLARFVDTNAGDWIRLDINARDAVQEPGGRRTLAEEIYTHLCTAGIRYALEEWNPDERCQTIRTAAQVMKRPGHGTCLDLAVLFAGVCLQYRLLPLLVVTEGHAFVVLSLLHDPAEWNSYGRAERVDFDRGVLTDAERVRSLIDDGAYVAVEVTGFAHSEGLPAGSLEGRGRTGGFLSFDQAVAAGRARLDADELRFVLDVAATHASGIGPQRICREQNEVVVGGNVLRFASPHGAELREPAEPVEADLIELPPPHAPPPRRSAGVVGRQRAKDLLRSAAPGRLVGVYGPEGIGKTELLRWLAYEPAPAELADGTVYVRSEGGGVLDILQEVFESVYEPSARTQLTPATAARYLGDKALRVLIDDLSAPVSDVTELLDRLPGSGIAATAPGPIAEGSTMALDPLDPSDAEELLRREVGPALAADAAARLGSAIAGVTPRAIVLVGRALATGEIDLDQAEAVLAAAAHPELTSRRRRLAALVRAASPAFVPERHLEAVVGDADDDLSALVERGLLETGSPRYRWVGGAVADADAEAAGLLLSRVVEWATGDPIPDDVVRDRGLVLRAARIGLEQGRYEDVIQLARGVEQWLAVGNRWDAWRSLLFATHLAAAESGDAHTLAWVDHQIGVQAMALGDAGFAEIHLRKAVERRRELGERDAADLTQLHLDRLHPPAPPSPIRRLTRWIRRHPWWTGLVAVVLIGVVAVLGTDEPRVSVAPFDAGVVPVGATVEAPLVVENIGDIAVDVGASLGDGGGGVFRLGAVPAACERVDPGAFCEIGVEFVPRSIGGAAGVVVVEYGGRTIEVEVRGAGELTLAFEGDGDFGEVIVGAEPPNRRIAVLNSGSLPVDGIVYSIEPSDGRFTLVGRPDLCARIRGGAACELEVVADPAGGGGSASLVAAVGEERVATPLSATTVEAASMVVIDAVDFGEVRVGEPSGPVRVAVENQGQTAGSVRLGLDVGDGFFIDSSQCTDVEPGRVCSLEVVFLPDDVGDYELAIPLVPGGPVQRIATGRAFAGPIIEFQGDPFLGVYRLSEGEPLVGAYAVANVGDRPTERVQLAFDGAGFRLGESALRCQRSLAPGEVCEFDVIFEDVPEPGAYPALLLASDTFVGDSLALTTEVRLGGEARIAVFDDATLREAYGGFSDIEDWLERYQELPIDPDELVFLEGDFGIDVGNVASPVGPAFRFRAALIIVVNGGDDELRIDHITNLGPNDPSFQIRADCAGVTLAPSDDATGDFCRIAVAFAPADIGFNEEAVSVLQLGYGAGGGPEGMVLRGELVVG